MRYNEILNEFLIQFKTLRVTIHRNPITPQILNLFKEVEKLPSAATSLDYTLRGIVVEGKVYVWPAYDAMHSEVIDELIFEGYVDQSELYLYTSFYLDRGIDDKKISSRGFYARDNKQGNRAILDKHIARWNS